MKKRVFWLVTLACICGLISSCTGGNEQPSRRLYEIKATGAAEVIVTQSYSCLSHARSLVVTWEYARVSGIDFETALAEMQGTEAREIKRGMESNKAKIEELMESLGDPPAELETAHQKLEELYQIYLDIHATVTEPSGEMEDFNQTINDFQEELLAAKAELDAMWNE